MPEDVFRFVVRVRLWVPPSPRPFRESVTIFASSSHLANEADGWRMLRMLSTTEEGRKEGWGDEEGEGEREKSQSCFGSLPLVCVEIGPPATAAHAIYWQEEGRKGSPARGEV